MLPSENSKALSDEMARLGYRIVAGGTDTHLFLVDLSSKNITGKDAATALDRAGIIVNKNAVPFDTQKPFITSGIRIGTPGITTRGLREDDATALARAIVDVLRHMGDERVVQSARARVSEWAAQFPVP